MKKHVTSIILILTHLSLCSQTTGTASTTCNEAMVLQAKGKWVKWPDLNAAVPRATGQQAYNRLDQIHAIIHNMYPSPVGVDVRWKRSIGPGYFGAQRKYYVNSNDVLTYDYSALLPIKAFGYSAVFPPYFCVHAANNRVYIEEGVKNESSSGIYVTVNDLEVGASTDDPWVINGLPVVMLSPIRSEKWKGYNVWGVEGSSISKILIHRPGVLPYIPVTRKQYIEHSLIILNEQYDKVIDATQRMPVRSPEEQEKEKKAKLDKFEKDLGSDPRQLKSAVDYYLASYQTDQQRRDEQVEKVKRGKEDVLRPFRDELEKATREGLLDSPALILVRYHHSPVFEPDPSKGYMLVTENPDYIRRDLPSYVPQFMIFSWVWTNYERHKELSEMFSRDFPIEKLQAMIDK